MAPPARLLPLRRAFRSAGLALLAAAAACVVAAAALDGVGVAWAAWAAATYLSWAVALRILVRRRLVQAAAGAEPRTEPGESPGRAVAAVPLLALGGLVAVAAATGGTHVTAGALAAAASTALAGATWTRRLQERDGTTLFVDLHRRHVRRD